MQRQWFLSLSIQQTNIGVLYFENNFNSFCKDDIDVIGNGNYYGRWYKNTFITQWMEMLEWLALEEILCIWWLVENEEVYNLCFQGINFLFESIKLNEKSC